jgi:predicted ATP-grasp superfamily ATP-dependent carboligase
MLAFLLHYRLLMHEFQFVFTLHEIPRKSTRLLGGMLQFFILCGKGGVGFILEDEVPHVLAVLPVELGDHVF